MNEIVQLLGWIRTDVLLVVGLLVAVMVTIHILLTKREVAAAVGWIALAWFSPLLGGFTYVVLGINRVRRRARRLRDDSADNNHSDQDAAIIPDGDHWQALARGIRAITNRPILAGNAVRMLQNGDEAYPLMLAAIETAQTSIGLSSYIMRADETGLRFVAALKAAQDRGVQVRVIVDGFGSGWFVSPAHSALVEAGVPVHRFMHSRLPWRMPFINLRTHRKILLVDGRIGFTGGINIADENVVAKAPPEPVQDTHFELRGPVIAQLAEAFAADWTFLTDEELDEGVWFPQLGPEGEQAGRVITAGPDQDLDKIEFAVLQAISCARGSIRVMTPYFLPDQQIMTALALAAMRGVAVEIIVPERGNHLLIDWATRAHIWPLLKHGCRVVRSPSPFRHSKLFVVDGAWSLIGSSNWDVRSFRLNFEICVEVYGRPLAAEIEAVMDANLGRPVERDELRRIPLALRLRDAAARLLLPYL